MPAIANASYEMAIIPENPICVAYINRSTGSRMSGVDALLVPNRMESRDIFLRDFTLLEFCRLREFVNTAPRVNPYGAAFVTTTARSLPLSGFGALYLAAASAAATGGVGFGAMAIGAFRGVVAGYQTFREVQMVNDTDNVLRTLGEIARQGLIIGTDLSLLFVELAELRGRLREAPGMLAVDVMASRLQDELFALAGRLREYHARQDRARQDRQAEAAPAA